MIVRWHIFKSDRLQTEAQLFLREGGRSDRVILFCPGFPGMGASMFEQRHAAALVESGYDVAVLKHEGIRMDSPTAPVMVNNAARLMQGRQKGESHIGGGPATIDEWLEEPLSALQELSESYPAIHVIGNSFGALSSLWSLTSGAVPLDSIKSILLKAGAQGIADESPGSIMRVWKPEYMTVPRITEKVTLNDPHAMAETFRTVYRELPERVRRVLPGSVPLTYLIAAKDEILRREDTEKFQAAIGGRGRIVVDTENKAWPEHGFLAHDMPDYRTEDLLRLLA